MPKTLLLADDSVVIQKLVGLSFANEDVEIITVDNGDDAVTRASEARPDLVLADVVMPGKSGYEVCEAIKQDPALAGTPVLLLTGTFEAFDENRAQQAGANGHITKPFEAQALVDQVNQLLAQSNKAPEAAAPAKANDFFDDNLGDLAGPGDSMQPIPPAAQSTPPVSNDFAFGGPMDEPLAGDLGSSGSGFPNATDTSLNNLLDGAAGDRTVAMMPDMPPAAPAPNAMSDPLMNTPPPLPQARIDPAPTNPNASSGNAFDSFDMGAPAAPASAPAAAPRSPDPAETVLADDSFGFGSPEPSAPPAREPLPTMDAAPGFADTQPSPGSADPLGGDLMDSGEPLDLDDLSFGSQPTVPPAPNSPSGDETVLAGDLFGDDPIPSPIESAPFADPTPSAGSMPSMPSTPPPMSSFSEPPAPSPAADFSAPSPAPVARDFAASSSSSDMPDFSAPQPEPEPAVPDFSAPEPASALPDFSAPSPEPRQPEPAFEASPEPMEMSTSNGLDLDFPEAGSPSAFPESIVPENADEYDVSSSELRIDPMSPTLPASDGDSSGNLSASQSAPQTPAAPMFADAPEEPAFEAPILDTPQPVEEPFAEAEPYEAPTLEPEPEIGEAALVIPTPEPEPVQAGDTSSSDLGRPVVNLPDITPMLRERVHETLEKVAWEAFSDLSETIVKQVLDRVEQVAWEVIPQMAETLIQEEIRRMKDETE